jgi:hypothetical protein
LIAQVPQAKLLEFLTGTPCHLVHVVVIVVVVIVVIVVVIVVESQRVLLY